MESNMQNNNSLKEQYKEKNLKILKEKLQIVNQKNIKESFINDMIIYEAFDKEQMKSAIDIIKKLKALNLSSVNTLAQARDAAVQDVTSVLAGENNVGLIRKIIDLFKDEKENPLLDTIAFADALQNFFKLFSQYIDSLNDGDDNKTVGEIVIGKNPNQFSDEISIQSLGQSEKKKLSNLQKIIVKGLKPEGNIASLGKNWMDKYLKGEKGLKSVANEILKAKIGDIKGISNNIESSFSNLDAVAQAASGASQQSSSKTTPTTGSEKTTSTAATDGTASTKAGTKTPTANVGSKEKRAKIAKKIQPTMKKLGIKNVDNLVTQLDKLGVLKDI